MSASIPARPAPQALSPEDQRARAQIDDALIERLVRGFYDKVRADDLIGPVFAERISDWEPHLQKMFAFWSSVALGTGRYEGNPMGAHLPLPVERAHFDRWLALFEETAHAVCPPEVAEYFIARAWRIAASFEMGIHARRGEIVPTRQRPWTPGQSR
ncbi:group III truncated hemoglobin [Pedomonas sp. V897]|uniref:group III truncated hemoglobin n=1 Tax=Pedomonas sp. V897 TaxID=3446482 RepID=UPI003EE35D8D